MNLEQKDNQQAQGKSHRPTLTPGEALWLQVRLEEHGRKIPAVYNYRPFYPLKHNDLEELVRAFREEAIGARERIWILVLERSIKGAWSKAKRQDAFWLRQRWNMAARLCQGLLERNNDSAIRATPPKDALETTKYILLDLWDRRLVDIWLREHAREYIVLDQYCAEERREELESFLQKFEASEIDLSPPGQK
jgi:hypothetical protein